MKAARLWGRSLVGKAIPMAMASALALTVPVFAQSSDPALDLAPGRASTVQLNPSTTLVEFEGQVGEAFTIRRTDQPTEGMNYWLLANGDVVEAVQYRYDNLLEVSFYVGESPYEVIVLPQTGTYQLHAIADHSAPTVTVTPATSYERIMAKANSTPTDEPARIDRAVALYTDAIGIAPEAIEPYVRRIGLNLIARQQWQFYSSEREIGNDPDSVAAELQAHYQSLSPELQDMVRTDLDTAAVLADPEAPAALYIGAIDIMVTTGELPAELADQLMLLDESLNEPSASEATPEPTAEES